MANTPFSLELAGISDEYLNFNNPRGARKLWQQFEERYQASFDLKSEEGIIYRNFPDGISQTIFNHVNEISWETTVKEPTEPLSTAWFLKGDIYNDTNGKPAEIIAAYEQGLALEPTNTRHALKLAELYRQLGRYNDVLRVSELAWDYAYELADLANIFTLFASFAQFKLKDLKLALLLMLSSITFEETDARIDLIADLNAQLAEPFDENSLDETSFDYVIDAEFPVGYNEEVEVALAEFGPELLELNLIDQAKDLYQKLFLLTEDDEYAEILSEL